MAIQASGGTFKDRLVELVEAVNGREVPPGGMHREFEEAMRAMRTALPCHSGPIPVGGALPRFVRFVPGLPGKQ